MNNIPYSCPIINEAIKRVWDITNPENREPITDQQKRLDNLLEEIRGINKKLRDELESHDPCSNKRMSYEDLVYEYEKLKDKVDELNDKIWELERR